MINLSICTIHCILSLVLLLLIVAIVYFNNKNVELFKTVQYMYQYKDALENHNFGPSVESCINECKQLNSDSKDQARCITYCGLNSRFIPYEEMIPNTETLFNYL
jgi:hypothetical protein